MYNVELKSLVTGISAFVKDGGDFFKIKIESLVDFPSIKEFNEIVYDIVSNYENLPISELAFDTDLYKIETYGMKCLYKDTESEQDLFDSDEQSYFSNFEFIDLKIKIKNAIPNFIFTLLVPSDNININDFSKLFKKSAKIIFSTDDVIEMNELKNSSTEEDEEDYNQLLTLDVAIEE